MSMKKDPYDDFDPRNYSYHTDEELDDVEYMEEVEEVGPLALPSQSQNSTIQYSQSQILSARRLPASTLLPRTKRKRARRESNHVRDAANGASAHSENGDESDIFASVWSMIENKEAKTPNQHENGADDTTTDPDGHAGDGIQHADQYDEFPRLSDKSDDRNIQGTKPVRCPRVEPSTGSIGTNQLVDENEESGPVTESGQHLKENVGNHASTPSMPSSFAWRESSASKGLEHELNRHRTQRANRREMRRNVALQKNILYDQRQHSSILRRELERQRMGSQEVISKSSKTRSRDTNAQRVFSRTAKRRNKFKRASTTTAQSSTSLIGSRPLHWAGKSERETRMTSFGMRMNPALENQRLRAAPPAAATRPDSSLLPIDASSTGLVRSPPPVGRDSTATPNENERRVGSNDVRSRLNRYHAEAAMEAMRASWKRNASEVPVNFAPSFLVNASTPQEALNVANQDSQPSQPHAGSIPKTPFQSVQGERRTSMVSGGSSGGNYSGSRNRKRSASSSRKRLRAGPLMKRLKSLRGSNEGDWVRLKSGMYPFEKSNGFDMNDPRNRAVSVMDVTIVGKPVPWEYNYEMLTMIGYVHSYGKKGSISTSVGTGPSRESLTTQNTTTRSSFFAWICFTFETAREHNIREGSRLRVYNAIILPARQEVDVPVCCLDHKLDNQRCNEVVVCTKLCEPYPASLPALTGICDDYRG